jgi:phosphoribosylformylglycinamidine synthase subunit PurQ / glutaminase
LQKNKIRICIVRVGGTNRDRDVARCFEALGVKAETIHLNDILRKRNLVSYNGLVFPGGFAYGDYVRAGAILGKKIFSSLKEEVRIFSSQGKPIIGICNGFQAMVEAGLLPGSDFLTDTPEAALAPNKSGHFECRWVKLRSNRHSPCLFTNRLNDIVSFPVAHGEGRFIAPRKILQWLKKNNLIALSYAKNTEENAGGTYPSNPNGSSLDIAGICNREGNVFGLMPHPENAFRGCQMPYGSGRQMEKGIPGDGYPIFESMIAHIENSF